MHEWMVSVDTEPLSGSEDALSEQLGRLADELEPLAPGAAVGLHGNVLGATFTVFGEEPREDAVKRGQQIFAAALRLAAIDATIATTTADADAYDDEGVTPIPTEPVL